MNPLQIGIMADEGVDTISAYTLTYPDEAVGIVRQEIEMIILYQSDLKSLTLLMRSFKFSLDNKREIFSVACGI